MCEVHVVPGRHRCDAHEILICIRLLQSFFTLSTNSRTKWCVFHVARRDVIEVFSVDFVPAGFQTLQRETWLMIWVEGWETTIALPTMEEHLIQTHAFGIVDGM